MHEDVSIHYTRGFSERAGSAFKLTPATVKAGLGRHKGSYVESQSTVVGLGGRYLAY